MIDDLICIRILKDAYATKNNIITSDMQQAISDELGDEKLYLAHVKHAINLFLVKEVVNGSLDDYFVPLEMTSDGVMYLQDKDSLASKVNTVTIAIRPDTLEDLRTLIKYAEIPNNQKDSLLTELGKHGAQEMVTKGVNYAFDNPKVLIGLLLSCFGISS